MGLSQSAADILSELVAVHGDVTASSASERTFICWKSKITDLARKRGQALVLAFLTL